MNDATEQQKMRFHVESTRTSGHLSQSRCKQALIELDTDMTGNSKAFNPAELLLSALSACMIKGIERVSPGTDLAGVLVRKNAHG